MAQHDFDPYALLDALRAGEDVDLIRSSVELVLQQLIEAEATATIGAAPHERSDERQNWRNGHRPRVLLTKAGDIELQVLKLRSGSFFPEILERRRRIDWALFAVVMKGEKRAESPSQPHLMCELGHGCMTGVAIKSERTLLGARDLRRQQFGAQRCTASGLRLHRPARHVLPTSRRHYRATA